MHGIKVKLEKMVATLLAVERERNAQLARKGAPSAQGANGEIASISLSSGKTQVRTVDVPLGFGNTSPSASKQNMSFGSLFAVYASGPHETTRGAVCLGRTPRAVVSWHTRPTAPASR